MAAAELDIPPPPPGFTMEGVPPPPPGFTITGGGAAVGNPNLRRQGDKALRPDVAAKNAATAIAGAGAVGGVMGAFAPELLNAGATIAGGLPAPFSGAAGPLRFMSGAARALGRPAGAITGAISGAVGETAGQAVEATGAPQPYAEAARFVAGGLAMEPYQLLKTYVTKPALTFGSHVKKVIAKEILGQIEGGNQKLSATQQKFIDDITSEIRGGSTKSDAPLEYVGSIMGQEGKRLMSESELQMANALRNAGKVGDATGYPGSQNTLADVGEGLQKSILARNKAALDARSAQYTRNEALRDSIVSQREAAQQYPKDLPEYSSIVKSLEQELAPGKRSPDVVKSFRNILSGIGPEKDAPATFQRIDDVRRQLGEVFRGKPPEGYEGIDANTARKYYGMLSDLQKAYAGGKNGPQAQLLDDYASRTEGLEVFSSRLGKKVTALDQYREGQYPDPSTIPSAFFKTRASIKALQELTGNKTQVENAALEFANKELQGKDSAGVRAWMSKNAEWLSETGATRSLVDKYATRLEGAERSLRNATEFAKQAERDGNMLIGKRLPAQRAIDLIRSGDADLWSKVTPVIAKSPQAKSEMVNAVRQVVASQAESNSTLDLFSRNIRPFLEKSNIAGKGEMDFIEKKLRDIQTMNIPEKEKLGMAKRILLNATSAWSASAIARGGVAVENYVNMIPE